MAAPAPSVAPPQMFVRDAIPLLHDIIAVLQISRDQSNRFKHFQSDNQQLSKMSDDSTCERARSDYVSGVQVIDSLAIHYFAETSFFDHHPNRDLILSSRNHIRNCPACQAWLKQEVPHEIFERLERVSKYCCIMMFAAVEEPESATVRFSFGLFRGEDPCWSIDGKSTCVSYCPWCGKRMPPEPFRNEDGGPCAPL